MTRARRRVPVDTARIDEIAARFAARGGQPGVAYGVVADGQLVHAGGMGESFAGGPVPEADTAFRIASMTKSFTASAIMLLREDGVLHLDDPAHRYVPELRGLRLPAADCRPVTIRQLLTMTAGFPTDDPWGDRQQGLPLSAFDELLATGGVRCCWAPGTRFEYSNLGYAVLGRLITAVTGTGYEAAIREMLLTPLGMETTGFAAGEFSPERVARGYRRDESGGWLELVPDPSGAFAPMGGIYSCVRDLARWVAGFADAFPARSDPAGDHPLGRAARREMQLPQMAIPAASPLAYRTGGPAAISYGFGLFAEEDPALGSITHHSGGYPGYGSQMRWHPATGTGAIVLANSTYAAAGGLASELLATMVAEYRQPAGGHLVRGPVPAPGGPWPETLAARDTVTELLQRWDDAVADRLFTRNVAQDRPLHQRRDDISKLRDRIGEFRPDQARPVESDSPAHCRWWLTGELGSAVVAIKLPPLRDPLVQQLVLAIPPAPGSPLDRAVAALIATANGGGRQWPADLPATLNTGAALRQLRLAAAWAGPLELTGYVAGDGSGAVTVELTGPDGRVTLTADVSGPGEQLRRAEISLLAA